MRITITIDCDNDAFQPEPGPELVRILEELKLMFVLAPNDVPYWHNHEIKDSRGNAVCHMKVT